MKPLKAHSRLLRFRLAMRVLPLLVLACLGKMPNAPGRGRGGEIMYVAAPEAGLRDRLATIYNHMGTVKNGDRVEVLERQKRFVRVRTAKRPRDGSRCARWSRTESYDRFEKLAPREPRRTGSGTRRYARRIEHARRSRKRNRYPLSARRRRKGRCSKRSTAAGATPEEIAAKRAAEVGADCGRAGKGGAKRLRTHGQPTRANVMRSRLQRGQPAQPSQPGQRPHAQAQPGQK